MVISLTVTGYEVEMIRIYVSISSNHYDTPFHCNITQEMRKTCELRKHLHQQLPSTTSLHMQTISSHLLRSLKRLVYKSVFIIYTEIQVIYPIELKHQLHKNI